MQEKRINWIDIARGIGIIFVIYAHALGTKSYAYLFYAFHMPFFFFLSGMLFKPAPLSTHIRKSTKTLLIPYVVVACISYAVWAFHIVVYHTQPFSELIWQFLSIFYGNSKNGLMVFNDVLWFLPTLFVTRGLFAFLYKVTHQTRQLLLILCAFSILGYIFTLVLPDLALPFGIEIALTAVVFYGIGFLWYTSSRMKELIFRHASILFPVLVIAGSLLAFFHFALYGRPVDMRLGWSNNYFLFYVCAFFGTFAWIACSVIVNKNRLLETIGKNSLILFAWHPLVFVYIGLFLSKFLPTEVIKNIRIILPACYTIISIVVLFTAKYFVEHLIVEQLKRQQLLWVKVRQI